VRFIDGGADIPDELLEAVRAGKAVFLCGAGVSLRVGLPDFKRLTKQVYERLGELPEAEPAEHRAVERMEFDRALRSLEKRTHRPGTESRVRKAVAELLAPPAGELLDHRALLVLSRDAAGQTRLLTTNFDTLFERAAKVAGMTALSYAGRAIPKPGLDRDHGILHLHGRIEDAELSLDATDLVLTSADFGDAYLREGWASRYMEDRMRLGALVLVGYAAEDAAMRLLLETLDADRGRFEDLKDIYALDVKTHESASLWKAKGIRPVEFTDFELLYRTLYEWASYASNPGDYEQRRIAAIFGS
jgi:SIR2-like domain